MADQLPRGAGRGTGLADALDRFLLPLVLIAAVAGISWPGPGRHADTAGAILITLAVLVFSTGASMTFREMSAIRTAAARLAVVLPVSTVVLPVLAWLASHLVSGTALRGGILCAGVAPAEVASVGLTGLAAGEAALAAGLLVASTVVTVLLAGPILSIAGARPAVSQAGLLVTLALVVALPLIAGSALRSADPFGGRERPVTRMLGTASLLVLLWEVASQLKLSVSDTSVLLALLAYLAGGVALGWVLSIGTSRGRRVAIVLPTAMRDFAVAAGIATSAFGAAAAAPLGIYGVLVLILGTVAVANAIPGGVVLAGAGNSQGTRSPRSSARSWCSFDDRSEAEVADLLDVSPGDGQTAWTCICPSPAAAPCAVMSVG